MLPGLLSPLGSPRSPLLEADGMVGGLGSHTATGTARVGVALGRRCRGRCQTYSTQRRGGFWLGGQVMQKSLFIKISSL